MQALAASGFRGFYERKAHFLQSVPYALKNVRRLLENATLPITLPALTAAFRSIVASEKLLALAAESEKRGVTASPEKTQEQSTQANTLTVRIFSFSFHRGGPPRDETGNGGG